jgi:hypothetical protein
MKKSASFLLVIILMAVIFSGCEKKENPPTLPPAGTMSINFSNFVNSKKSLSVADKTNWTLAATTAGVWNILLAVNLVIPVVSFELAVNNTPVYLDNKWVWKYNFNGIGATYKARLTGQVISGNVKWEMYISRDGIGAFDELLWYEGTSKTDGTSGQWVLNHSQQFPEPMLQIDWEAAGSKIGKIKYTYIRDKKDDRTTEPFKGSYIQYGLTTNILNAFYDVHQNTGVVNVYNDIFIEWNTTTHNGHIKATSYFQDNLWHCWNETGDNITCN